MFVQGGGKMINLLKEMIAIFSIIIMLLSAGALISENGKITTDDNVIDENFYGLKNFSDFVYDEGKLTNYDNSKFWGIAYGNTNELRGEINE